MQASYVIGIDIGTGSVKAVAVAQNGTLLNSAQVFYAVTSKTEQDPEVVWKSFVESIQKLVAFLQTPPAAICLSSAMHSVLAVDAEGRPLTKAILWSDKRSTAIAQALRSSPLGVELYLATGTPLHSMSPLCKIRWWQENDSGVFNSAYKFISIKEAIWHRLFGEFVVDYSIASATGLFNHQQKKWEEGALLFAGIKTERLSIPVPVSYQTSGLSEATAKLLQIPADTSFVIGGSDGCMANLGSLCLSPTEAAVTIGTSAAVRITSQTPVKSTDNMIFSYILEEQTFVCGGAINNGGNVFGWLLNKMYNGHSVVKSYEDLFQAIGQVPAGSEGLLFLPYLHGERAPIWDEESCGIFFGLTAAHSLHHLARAAAEGVCFALGQILAILEEKCGAINKLQISGGLVEVDVMMQMLADATGKEVVVQQTEDASAIGAAFLALKTVGWIEDYAALPKGEGLLYSPQDGSSKRYRQLFSLYKSLYPLLKQSMHSLHPFHS